MKSRVLIAVCFGIVLFAGCSSTPEVRGSSTGSEIAAVDLSNVTTRSATGPISQACLFHDRPKATKKRCLCIQAAADLTLSRSDQARGARYFGNPDALQQTRQSGAPGDERFWEVWKVFVGTAEQLCTA